MSRIKDILPEIIIVKCPADGSWPDPIMVKEETVSCKPNVNPEPSHHSINPMVDCENEPLSDNLLFGTSKQEGWHHLVPETNKTYDEKVDVEPSNGSFTKDFDVELHEEIIIKEDPDDDILFDSEEHYSLNTYSFDKLCSSKIKSKPIEENIHSNRGTDMNPHRNTILHNVDKVEVTNPSSLSLPAIEGTAQSPQISHHPFYSNFSEFTSSESNQADITEDSEKICFIQNTFSQALICSICNKRYQSFRAYYVHVTRHHTNDDVEEHHSDIKSKCVNETSVFLNAKNIGSLKDRCKEIIVEGDTQMTKDDFSSDEDMNRILNVQPGVPDKNSFSEVRESNTTILSDDEDCDSGIFSEDPSSCSIDNDILSEEVYNENHGNQICLEALNVMKHTCHITPDFEKMQVCQNVIPHFHNPRQYQRENTKALRQIKALQDDSKLLKCNQCDFRTIFKHQIKAHIQSVHDNIKDIIC